MKNFNLIAILILSFIFSSTNAAAQTKRKTTPKKTKTPAARPSPKPEPKSNSKPMPEQSSEYKILLAGAYSKVETPFVMVARDAETYALIRALVENLPPSADVDFTKSAVVAAFVGQKNTGGYSVKMRPFNGQVSFELNRPQPGDAVTQVITNPFQVVAVPLDESMKLLLNVPAEWKSLIQNYHVTKSEFESSGGFAGRMKKFSVRGNIGVMTHGDLVTYFFDLAGTSGDSSRKLIDTASGVVKEGKVEITKMDAGTLSETPRPPLKAFGTISKNKFSLMFESFPPTASDGYMTRGNLEAAQN